jgi:hypothetical protein
MVNVIKGFFALLLTCMLACMAYVHFNQAGLSKKVLGILRSQLSTELAVGAFEVDVLTAFPRVAFNLQDVTLKGKGGGDLIQASKLRATISLFSALSGDVQIRRISLSDGEISVRMLKDGTLSLEVTKPSDQQGGQAAQLAFHRIDLKNILMHYDDPNSDSEFAVRFVEGSVKGAYRYNRLKLDLQGDVIHERVRFGKDVFLNGAKGKLSGHLDLNFGDKLYEFEDVAIDIGAQSYTLEGNIRDAGEHQYVDLLVEQTKGQFGSFLTILPARYRSEIPFTDVQGTISAAGTIRGRMSAEENPHLHFDFIVKNASVKSRNGMGSLEDLDITGVFDNGAMRRMQSSIIELPLISGKTRGQDLKAALVIKDLSDPVLTCNFDGSIPANFVMDYAGLEEIKEATGTLHFNDVRIGPLRLSNTNLTDVSAIHGTCSFDDVSLVADKTRFLLKSGSVVLDRDTMTISDLALSTDADQMKLTGWVSGIGDALQSGDPAYLRYDIAGDAAKLNIGTWVPEESANAQTREPRIVPVSSKISVPLRMPEGALHLNAVHCTYNNIVMDAVKAEIQTWKHLIRFDITGHTSGGKLHAAGSVDTEKGYLLKLQLSGDALEIRDCFNQCANFGQDVIRGQHLEGKCDLLLLAEVPWTLDGEILNDRIHVLAGLMMTDGELVGFDMLEQFSTYVHADDLKRVKFQRLDNFIEVRKGNVYIPAMFIQSNAANFVVNGVHTLDNRILYNLKINAGQVLSNKMKKHNPALAPLPARKEGTFNMHFSISGTTEDFTYGMNRVSVESSFEQSAEMRLRIRDELREVFGESVDLIEPPEWETIPEYGREVMGEETYLEWKD